MNSKPRETNICLWLLIVLNLRYVVSHFSAGRFEVDKVGEYLGKRPADTSGGRVDTSANVRRASGQ